MKTKEERVIDVEEAIATLRLEGMEPTDISLKYARQYIDGDIDVYEMARLVSLELRTELGISEEV